MEFCLCLFVGWVVLSGVIIYITLLSDIDVAL